MERDVAFYFLNDLVDVAVEHCHRAEVLKVAQGLRAVLGTPAPLGKDCPKRDMGKQDDRRAGGTGLKIIFQPFQLLSPENAQAAFLDVHDIDQADEMHAFLIEAVPARALRSFAEPVAILLSVIIEDVMLSRHIEHLPGFAAFQDLVQRVELLRLGKMSQVAGVQHE